LIAKIDQLVNHKAYPEPKSLSQLVYEKTHPRFEEFEKSIQDAWDVGMSEDPIQRQQGGGCCGAPKAAPQQAQKGGCGCGPKAGGSGGCGCGPAAAPERQGGGGCCGAPKEEESPSAGKGRKTYEPNLVPADLANKVYRLEKQPCWFLYTIKADNFGPSVNFKFFFHNGLLSSKCALQKDEETENCRNTLNLQIWFRSFLCVIHPKKPQNFH
jgi:hypothetical protein